MGWLEVMPDTSDRSLAISEPFPVLFTSARAVAEELNRVLPASWAGGTSRASLAGLLSVSAMLCSPILLP